MKKTLSTLFMVILLLSTMSTLVFAQNTNTEFANDSVIPESESDYVYDPDDWIDDSIFHEEQISLMASSSSTRYTILTLDVSGSMAGTQITKLKESAKYFCEQMLAARGNNYIAIVKFASSTSLACGFTDDISALTSAINALSASGTTDTAAGLRKAKQTYDSLGITELAERNVVLISDGQPDSTSAAISAFNEISSSCNVYTLGYNLSSSALTCMDSIQNCGFYNATDTSSMQSAVMDIINAILAGTIGNIYDLNTESNSITVYGNQKSSSIASESYRVLENAKILINGNEYYTNANGVAVIPSITSGSVTVSKENYITKTVTAASLNASKKVYLQKDDGNGPIINSVMVENIDILTSEYPIDLTSKDSITLKADILWRTGSYSKVRLIQDSTSVSFNNTTLTITLSNHFDVSKDIYIVATDTNGNTTKKKLMFVESGGLIDALDGLKLAFNDEIKLTLPKSFPLLGGSAISVGLKDAVTELIPVQISNEGNKVYVSIGIDLVEYAYKDNYATSNSSGNRAHVLKRETKTAVDKIKDLYKSASLGKLSDAGKKLKNLKQTYKTALKYPQGSFGFSADFTLLGFMEGYVDSNGKLVFLSSGLILNPSVSLSWSGQASVGPVPVYWEAAIAAEIEARGNLRQNPELNQLIPQGEVSGSLGGSIGGGVGLNKVLSIGGGGGLEFEPLWILKYKEKDYFRLDASLNAYFKVVVGWLTYTKQWSSPKATLLEYPSAKLMSLSPQDNFDLYDVSNYELQDRDYISKDSVFAINDTIHLFDDKLTSTVFKSNIYTDSDPQLIRLSDDKLLAVWLDDDTQRSAVNRTALTYSYYDGNTWSEPMQVESDGTADFEPTLKLISGTAYLAWQDEKQAYLDTDSAETICSGMEITAAKYNENTNTFEVIFTTSNSSMDYMPTLYAKDGEPAILWARNIDNNIFGATENNHIISQKLSSASEEVLASAVGFIGALSGSLNGDYAYHVDMDANLETIEDKEICVNGARITDNGIADLSPIFDNNGNMYFYSNGSIMRMDENGNTVAIIDDISTDNYQLIESKNGEKALIYECTNGMGADIYANVYNSTTGIWADPISITKDAGLIHGFGAVIDDTRAFTLLANITEIAEDTLYDDPYGQTDLVLYSELETSDAIITDVMYSTEYFVRDSDCYFDVHIKNNSAYDLKDYEISVVANGKLVSTYKYDETIVPGGTAVAEVLYPIPDDLVATELTLILSPSKNDADMSNNMATVDVSYEDISIENIDYGTTDSGQTIIYADIVNRGYGNGKNIVVSLIEGSPDGNVIAEQTVTANDFLSIAPVEFCVDSYVGDLYFISIDIDDDSFSSNEQFVVIENKYYEIVNGGAVIIDGSAYDTATITIPSSLGGYPVIKIADGAYDSCSNVQTVIVPNTVTEIGNYAFANCTNLESITIPSSVETISNNAFENVSSDFTIHGYAGSTAETYAKANGYPFVAFVAVASGECGDNLSWILYDNGELVISGTGEMWDWGWRTVDSSAPWSNYRSLIKTATIESGVTSIGECAFYNCSSLTSVSIPNSVTRIGFWAFYTCNSLPSVYIPESVTNIHALAFNNCNSLTSVTVDESNANYSNDEDGVLFSKDKTTLVLYPAGNTRTSYTIPDSVTSIGRSAFYGCDDLTIISIPDSVTIIDHYAFEGCTNLTSATIYSQTTRFGEAVFTDTHADFTIYGYTGSSAQTYANSNGHKFVVITASGTCGDDLMWGLYDDGTLIVNGTGAMSPWKSSTSVPWNGYRAKIKHVIIEAGVTSIGDYAFSSCTNLTDVIVSNNVTSIGDYAFKQCSNLSSIDLPASVNIIGAEAFYNCYALPEIIIHNGVTVIENGAFYGCSGLTDIEISEYAESIGSNAFANCSNLKKVIVYSPNVTFGSNTFGNTHNDLVIHSYEKSTAQTYASQNGHAFRAFAIIGKCGDNLTWVLYDDGELLISGTGAMWDWTTHTDTPWYDQRTLIKSVTIKSGVTSIGDYAFCLCAKMTCVDIGDTVRTIGDHAFKQCSSLTELVLPDSITAIGDESFNDCSSIVDIKISKNLTTIGDYAFNSCDSLASITVDAANPNYSSDEYGVLFNKNKTTIIQYPIGNARKAYIIPSSVKTIGNYSFYQSQNLTSVAIAGGVTTIQKYAFAYCSNLMSIRVPSSVTSIGGYAFAYCTGAPYAIVYSDTAVFSISVFYKNGSTFAIHAHPGSTSETYAKKNYHSFVAMDSSITADDADSAITRNIINPTNATVTVPASGWIEGDNTFSLTSDNVCIVLVSHDNGITYDRITATANGNKYDYTTQLTIDSTVTVAISGDANGDDRLTNADATRLKAYLGGKTTLGAKAEKCADASKDNKITNTDATRIKAALGGKRALNW